MRKQIHFILGLCLFFSISAVQATTVHIQVGANGGMAFAPTAVAVTVGDTVQFDWTSGTHTTTSTGVPTGAATWNSQINSSSTTFKYKVTVAGTYNYQCTYHASMGMTGVFTATAPTTGISEPTVAAGLNAYPNPFTKKLTVDLGNTDVNANSDISVVNILGKVCYQAKVNDLLAKNSKMILDLDNLTSGIYFVYVNTPQKRITLRVIKNDNGQ